MIQAEHVLSNQQETSFSEAPGTSTDKNAVVSSQNSITDEQDISQNQAAIASPNTIVRQLSESSDDWSSSSESDVTQDQLVEQKKKDWMVQRSPQTTIENKVSNAERTTITNRLKNEYHAATVKVINNHYYGNSLAPTINLDRIDGIPAEKITIDKDRDANVEPNSSDASSQPLCTEDKHKSCFKSCANKRCIASLIAASLGVSILIFLCTWLPNSNVMKQLIPVTPISSTAINAGNLLSTTELALTSPRTISSDQVIHASTDDFSRESTTSSISDYSHNSGQKKQTNEITGANNPLKIVTRAEWDAAPPLKPPIKLKVLPAARVIISETSTESCDETEKCTRLIRKIQRLHLNPVSCPDIAYNFLVGGDGLIYEGRGWGIKGNVAAYFDHESINIAFIGNFSLFTPPEKQVEAALKLIRFGVDDYNISMFFKLSGKRQLTYMNENPGDKLYNIIKKWQQWQPGTIGIDLNYKSSDDEYNRTISYLNLFFGTNLKYVPRRGRN